jgi:hypothetical protein
MKNTKLRLEVGDGGSLEVGGLIHRSDLIKPQHISIMKIQRMLGRGTKSQDRGKPTNGDRIFGAICHPSDAGAIFVEEEG